MNPERYERIASIFAEVRALPTELQSAALDRLCGGDAELRAAVEEYLRGDVAGDPTLLARPVLEDPALLNRALGTDAEEHPPASRIGPYTIVERLGEGGFGVVYIADQTGPIRRRVALKVIKPGMDSRAVIARFEQERQALAVMDHPNVAKVFDGGVTAPGRPYFVMEYVKGEPITDYCDRRALSIRERLELFIPVCEAVQHAHHKGIIHRDLKPSNVLVMESEGRSIPKVIDFGIAKAIDQAAFEQTVFSLEGQFIGTPEYMSPEQAGGRADIDTRTDVYSLGVMLYELLVGRLPFESSELRSKGRDEMRRIIREEEPPRPGTRLGEIGDAGDRIATARRDSRASMLRELRRELEWVPLKALRKERERRYDSPAALAEDIRRYLDGRPLRAAPESRAYRARKFVRRNRPLVIGVAAVVLALSAGLAGTIWQAREASKAESEARQAQRVSEELRRDAERKTVLANASLEQQRDIVMMLEPLSLGQAFLAAIRSQLEPATSGAEQTELLTAFETVRAAVKPSDVGKEVLKSSVFERASRAAHSRTGSEPEVASNKGLTLGSVAAGLGLYEFARAELEWVISLAEANGLPSYARQAKIEMAPVLAYLQHSREALALLEPIIAENLSTPEDEEAVVAARANKALILDMVGRSNDSTPLHQEVVAARARLYGDDDERTLSARNNLALALTRLGKLPEAEDIFAEVLERRRTTLGPDDPATVTSFNNLVGVRLTRARAVGSLADLKQLLPELEQVASECERVLGADDRKTLTARMSLATAHTSLGHTEQAEDILVDVQATSVRLFGLIDATSLQASSDLGNSRLRRTAGATGEVRERLLVEAGAILEPACDAARRVLPEADDKRIQLVAAKASLLRLKGRHGEALPLYDEAIAAMSATAPPDSPLLLTLRINRAGSLVGVGRFEEGVTQARELYRIRRERLPKQDPRSQSLRRQVSDSTEKWAAALRENGEEARAAEVERATIECLRAIDGEEPPK